MTQKRCKKLIMSLGFGAYNAEILIHWYKERGYKTNESIFRCVFRDLGKYKIGGHV